MQKWTLWHQKWAIQPYIHPFKDLKLEPCKKCSKPTMGNISQIIGNIICYKKHDQQQMFGIIIA
jgi:hypothetical protein